MSDTRDWNAEAIDDLRTEVARLEADRAQWKARAEAAEAELNSMRGTDLYFWRAECFNAQESLIKRRARIAELEAALAARASVPDREKVARAICAVLVRPSTFMGDPPVQAMRVARDAADAAIAAMKGETP